MPYQPILESMHEHGSLQAPLLANLDSLDAIIRRAAVLPQGADRTASFYNAGIFTPLAIDRYNLNANYNQPRQGIDWGEHFSLHFGARETRPEVRHDFLKAMAEVEMRMQQKYDAYRRANGRRGDEIPPQFQHVLNDQTCQQFFNCNVHELTFEIVAAAARAGNQNQQGQNLARFILGLNNQEAARIVDDMEHRQAKHAVERVIAERYSSIDATVDEIAHQIRHERSLFNRFNDGVELVTGSAMNGLTGRLLKGALIYGGAVAQSFAGVGLVGKLAVAGSAALGLGIPGAFALGLGATYLSYKALGAVGSQVGAAIGGEFARHGYRRAAKLGTRLGGLLPISILMGPGLVAGALALGAGFDYTREVAADRVIEHKQQRQAAGPVGMYDDHRSRGESVWYAIKEMSKLGGHTVYPAALALGSTALINSDWQIHPDINHWKPTWLGMPHFDGINVPGWPFGWHWPWGGWSNHFGDDDSGDSGKQHPTHPSSSAPSTGAPAGQSSSSSSGCDSLAELVTHGEWGDAETNVRYSYNQNHDANWFGIQSVTLDGTDGINVHLNNTLAGNADLVRFLIDSNHDGRIGEGDSSYFVNINNGDAHLDTNGKYDFTTTRFQVGAIDLDTVSSNACNTPADITLKYLSSIDSQYLHVGTGHGGHSGAPAGGVAAPPVVDAGTPLAIPPAVAPPAFQPGYESLYFDVFIDGNRAEWIDQVNVNNAPYMITGRHVPGTPYHTMNAQFNNDVLTDFGAYQLYLDGTPIHGTEIHRSIDNYGDTLELGKASQFQPRIFKMTPGYYDVAFVGDIDGNWKTTDDQIWQRVFMEYHRALEPRAPSVSIMPPNPASYF